jgi:rod shape-determining protein MreC
MRTTSARSVQSLVLALVIIGLIGLALGGYLAPITRVVFKPFIGAQTWLATRYQSIQNSLAAPQDLARLRQRNTELEAEVSRLQTEIVELQQQIAETRILSALLDFAQEHTDFRYVTADVIGRDTSPFVKYVIINRGSDDGLRRGMPVVTSQGLVGRIAAVTSGAARVQLITDPDSSVNVRIEPGAAQGMLRGDLTGELSLEMVPQSAGLKTGDLVLSSGLGGNYPNNILVGQVTNVVKKETDLFQEAGVQPIVDFSRLEIVLVIVNFRPVDISPLIPTPSAP